MIERALGIWWRIEIEWEVGCWIIERVRVVTPTQFDFEPDSLGGC